VNFQEYTQPFSKNLFISKLKLYT